MISNTDNTIDSKDIINRLDELESELDDIEEECDQEEIRLEEHDDYDDVHTEYVSLDKVRRQAENISDWEYGVALIREDYLLEYVKDIINDCYNKPQELDEWPWSHMTMDWDAVVDDERSNMTSIDFDGETYYVRD